MACPVFYNSVEITSFTFIIEGGVMLKVPVVGLPFILLAVVLEITKAVS